MELWIHVEGTAPTELGPHRPSLSLGRAADNDLVVDHPSISRRHAMFYWRAGEVILQDLGSLNGTLVNGEWLTSPAVVDATDTLQLGLVPAWIECRSAERPAVEEAAPPEGSQALRVPLEGLPPVDGEGHRHLAALQAAHDLSLFLVQDGPLQPMLAELLERLFRLLEPSRCALLLLDAAGVLEQVASRSRQGGDGAVRLSRTMVQAALERGEAILLQQPRQDPHLGKAASVVLSGVHSVLTVPLIHDGEVLGLLYLDAGITRRAFREEDLTVAATLGRLAAAKVHQTRQARALSERREAGREAFLALGLQQRFLQPGRPRIDLRYKVHGKVRPAAEPGGDFIDHLGRGDRLILCMGDVPGKGLGAVSLMAMVKTLFRGQAALLDSPSALMASVHARLMEDVEPGSFVRAFCAFLDLPMGQLSYSLGGHPRPFVLSSTGALRQLQARPAPPLGVSPKDEWPLHFASLEPGDLLVAMSDALLNVLDESRLASILAPCAKDDPALVTRTLLDAAETALEGRVEDDLTVLCVRYRGQRPV